MAVLPRAERAPPSAADARRHLEAIAREPRPAGSAAEARARAYSAEVLRELGFQVSEEPFDYSAFPGRWATPLAGVASIVLLAAAGHVGFRGAGGLALAILTLGAMAVGVGALWAARRGVLEFPLLRSRSVNLVARRGTPSLWLVAHLDSKSQPVPMLVRIAGIVLTAVSWVGAFAVAGAQVLGVDVVAAWLWISGAGMIGGLPVAASLVGERSAGAVDDASGVATVLLAAAALPRERSLGVLLTSAEELGLAGARAWVRATPTATACAINVDGIDDEGTLRCLGDRRGHAVAAAVRRGGAAAGAAVVVRRSIPGVLTDGVALADAGWPVVTIAKGTVRTLARVHTPADRGDRLEGVGVAVAAEVVAAAAEELG